MINNDQPPARADAAHLTSVYRVIESELAETTRLLKSRLAHENPLFNEYLEYSFRLGGKRLRPALLLLCGKAWGRVEPRHYLCGAALEMIHTGSLVHDDILDGARFRRQLETFNAKWDTKRAVLVGDLLITRALAMICECRDSTIFSKTAEFCTSTVEGELFQEESVGNFELTFEEYRRIIGGKTASLIEAATYLGGYLARAEEEDLASFSAFGRALGMAFQIVDDALDLVGDEEKVGKTLGSDLANQKETLPLILYFQRASAPERERLRARLKRGSTFEDRRAVAAILRDSGALDETRRIAEDLTRQARETISGLRRRGRELGLAVDESAFDSLEALANYVARREI